jgi:hypothetical protein
MATVNIYLEPRKLDREYAHPFFREAKYGDIVEFKAIGDTFTISMSNLDNFISKVNGSPAGTQISETITAGNTVQVEISGGPLLALSKNYEVYCNSRLMYADRPGASPPKIIIVP